MKRKFSKQEQGNVLWLSMEFIDEMVHDGDLTREQAKYRRMSMIRKSLAFRETKEAVAREYFMEEWFNKLADSGALSQ